MDSLAPNRTWYLVDLPAGCKTIWCKWVFRKKLEVHGTVDKYEAPLVTKGYKQRENVDFLRVLLSTASIYNLLVN